MRRIVIKTVILALVITTLITVPCFADTSGGQGCLQPPVNVHIPVSHVVSGKGYSGGDRFSFTLEADEEGDPMPSGAEGSSMTITVKGRTGAQEIDFGDISFDSPGIYHYTISREPEDHARISEDDSEYKVMIAVLNDRKTEMTIYRLSEEEDGGKAGEIIYKDTYSASPKTGDAAWKLILPAAAGTVALGLLLIMLFIRREEGDEKQI